MLVKERYRGQGREVPGVRFLTENYWYFKPAKCPNCAGDLQVPDDRDSVKCMYCGSDIVVREAMRLSGGVSIDNLLKLAQAAEESRHFEEAYSYYSKILEHDSNNMQAWVGKGTSILACEEPLLDTAKTCFDNALKNTNAIDNLKILIIDTIIRNLYWDNNSKSVNIDKLFDYTLH